MDCETKSIFKLNQLPPEILECAFHYLPRTSLKECQKVNKAWYALSSPLIWEIIEINNKNQISSILSNLSNKTNSKLTKYVKSLFMAIYYGNIEIDLIKQLLLLFPRIEKVYMPQMDFKSISELNNQEYLSKFVQNCPNITSFQFSSLNYTIGTMVPVQKYVNDVLYALRHTLLKITIEGEKKSKDYWDLSETLAPFSQLEELKLQYIKGSYGIKWWLPIFNVLPRLKSLHVQVTDERDPCLIDQDVEAFIDKNTLQKRLGEVEELRLHAAYHNRLHWFTPALIRFITQNFIGLKDIHLQHSYYCLETLVQEDLWAYQELLNFICSREKYCVFTKLNVQNSERNYFLDFLNMFFHTNFNHTLLDNRRNAFNNLQIFLCCDDFLTDDNWDTIVQPRFQFDITLMSKRINNHQIMRTTLYTVNSPKQDKDLVRKSFSSILPTLNENDTLTIYIKSNSETFPFASFELVGQALSMIPGSVKKVTLEIDSDVKWSQYFMKYKKIQNYHQFTHLEILVDIVNSQTADQLGFSQLSIIFPNVKNLALQYYNGIWDEEKYEFLMNLSRLTLDHFTLDISLIKYKARQLMKEHNDFCGMSCILHIETSINEYYYQISFGDLSIKELQEEYIKETHEPKMITAHIILNDIKCLELYLLSLFMNIDQSYDCLDIYYYDYDNNSNYYLQDCEVFKIFENKINFT